MKALKSGSVSQADVDRAKAQLKVTILEQLGTSSGRFDDLVAQTVRGEIQGKSELVAAIDAITVADVNAVSALVKAWNNFIHFFSNNFAQLLIIA